MGKTLIKNAKIFDGTGNRPFYGDVLLGGNKIERVNYFIEADGCDVVDATGLVLAPGFINVHSHAELETFVHPEMEQIIGQGITTEIVGQDGLSVAPITDERLEKLTENMIPLCGILPRPYPWRTYADFVSMAEEQDAACHLVGLVGSGTIRLCIVGDEKRPATQEEREKMCALLDKCMKEGARGLSFGLIYPPSCYASIDEMVALCRVVAKNDGIVMVHIRNEMDKLIEAFEEMVTVMKSSGARMEISHLKALGPQNWGSVKTVLDRINQLQTEGYDIGFDQYPWSAGSTGMKVMIPGWAYSGGIDAFEKRLEDPETLKKIVEETTAILKMRGGSKNIQISTVPEGGEEWQWMCGLRLNEVVERLKMDDVSAILYILKKTHSSTVCVYHSISEEDVCMVMKNPSHVVCTDGIVGTVPHPRAYSSFPRFLGHYVRDMKIMSLETAINHISGEPARRLRLWDRGLIREGLLADLVLLDYEKINDTNSYANPKVLPTGICKVWKSGALRYKNNN